MLSNAPDLVSWPIADLIFPRRPPIQMSNQSPPIGAGPCAIEAPTPVNLAVTVVGIDHGLCLVFVKALQSWKNFSEVVSSIPTWAVSDCLHIRFNHRLVLHNEFDDCLRRIGPIGF